jgi:hypothetical protein
MSKWKGLSGPITAELAEAEPVDQRLFSRPRAPISGETCALLAQVERAAASRHAQALAQLEQSGAASKV